MSNINANALTVPTDADSFRVWAESIQQQLANLQANRGQRSIRMQDIADVNLVPPPSSTYTPLVDKDGLLFDRASGNWVPAAGSGGIQGDRLVLVPTVDDTGLNSGAGSYNVTVDDVLETSGASLIKSVGDVGARIVTAGVYLATFTVTFSANTVGSRYIGLKPTGGTVMREQGMSSAPTDATGRSSTGTAGPTTMSITAWFDFTSGGTDLHPVVAQDSGSTLTVVAAGTQMSVLRLA